MSQPITENRSGRWSLRKSLIARKIGGPVGRLFAWLGFCVFITVIPLFAQLGFTKFTHQPFNSEKFLGEFLAITIAICGEFIGFLLLDGRVHVVVKWISGIGGVSCLLGAALSLGALSTSQPGDDIGFAQAVAIVVFAGAVVCGSICKLAEKNTKMVVAR